MDGPISPLLEDKLLKLMALAAKIMDRDDVPDDLRLEAQRIFNLHEKATRYTPHIERTEICLEPE